MDFVYQWLAKLGYTHPIHPPMTYIPLGMVIGALVFRLCTLFLRQPKYTITARHCITLAFIGVFPTMLSGYMDWQYYYGGAWLFAIRMKITLAIVLTLLLLATVLLHIKLRPGALVLLILYFLAFLNIIALGYYGGELIFGDQAAVAGKQPDMQVAAEPDGQVTFSEVQAIFEQNCVMCHSGPNASKNLQLTSYEQVMQGSESGAVVIPGQPEQSELVRRIKGISQPRMPLANPPLPDGNIRKIESWIQAGALNE
jgi:uncharacterized membrane protein